MCVIVLWLVHRNWWKWLQNRHSMKKLVLVYFYEVDRCDGPQPLDTPRNSSSSVKQLGFRRVITENHITRYCNPKKSLGTIPTYWSQILVESGKQIIYFSLMWYTIYVNPKWFLNISSRVFLRFFKVLCYFKISNQHALKSKIKFEKEIEFRLCYI